MMETLKKKYELCNKCEYCINSCKVFGHGNPKADIMVIGEGPGRTECETGVLFTGPAGQLLDKILAAINLKREELYFTNIVACRTNEKNRTPSWIETQNCAERLNEEMNIIKPNIILMLGSPSLKRFFGRSSKVSESHGRWFMDFKPPYARFFSLFHPSWALHSSTADEMKAKKRTIWNDIKKFKDELDITNFNLKE